MEKSHEIVELGDQIAELSAHIFAATARLLTLIGEFDAVEGWARLGMGSCAQWLSWRCGLSRVTAHEQVRVARALRELPLITEAFSQGQLSYSKVRSMTRIADHSNEELLLAWATQGTASQMEQIVRGLRRAVKLQHPDQRHKRRSLTWNYDEQGCLVIRARLAPEEGVVVVAALTSALEQLEGEDAESSAEESDLPTDLQPAIDFEAASPGEQQAADALVSLAESFLAHGAEHLVGEQRAVVVIHTDDRIHASDARSELPGHASVHPETLRRIACDAGVIRVDDVSVTIGRRSRVVPKPMRRALHRRDRTCRYPSCSARKVDAHHIQHWSRGGETSLRNLVLMCRRHHRAVHEGGYALELGVGGDVRVTHPDGRPLPHVPRLPVSAPSAIADANRAGRLRIDATTAASHWHGHRPDYSLAVAGLLALDTSA